MGNFIETLCLGLEDIFNQYDYDSEFENIINSDEFSEQRINELINIGTSLEHKFTSDDAELFDTYCKIALHLIELGSLNVGDLVIVGDCAYILGEIDYEDLTILVYTKNDDFSWMDITELNFFSN